MRTDVENWGEGREEKERGFATRVEFFYSGFLIFFFDLDANRGDLGFFEKIERFGSAPPWACALGGTPGGYTP